MAGMRIGRTLPVLVAVLVGTACSNADEPAVREAASSSAGGDAAARCGLLATATMASLVQEEGTPCAEAIGQPPLGSGDVVSVAVWGEDALVHLTDDTLFLTRTDAGWQISAAACEPAGASRPYDCQLAAS
jgi:hypothetical protein